jgi:hypothetical protein
VCVCVCIVANNGYEQQNTAVNPLDYRKNNVQHQDDGTAVNQLIHERQSTTHDTVDTESTYDNVSQQHNKPSDNRNNRSNSPDQTDESMKITSSELRQSSEDAQVNVKITTQSSPPASFI